MGSSQSATVGRVCNRVASAANAANAAARPVLSRSLELKIAPNEASTRSHWASGAKLAETTTTATSSLDRTDFSVQFAPTTVVAAKWNGRIAARAQD